MGKVELSVSRCKGCGYCISFCPTKAISKAGVKNSKGYEVVNGRDSVTKTIYELFLNRCIFGFHACNKLSNAQLTDGFELRRLVLDCRQAARDNSCKGSSQITTLSICSTGKVRNHSSSRRSYSGVGICECIDKSVNTRVTQFRQITCETRHSACINTLNTRSQIHKIAELSNYTIQLTSIYATNTVVVICKGLTKPVPTRLVILSFFTGMDSYTKCFAAKDERAAKRGSLLAALAMLLVAIGATLMGLAARVKYPGLTDSGDVAYRLIFDYFPSGMRSIALVGVLAAIMSSADICILTASANLSKDIYQRHIGKDKGEKHLFAVGIVCSFIVGLLGLLVAVALKSVIDILYLCMTINGAGLFLPTIAAMYWDYHDSRSACASILVSLVVVIVWYVLGMVTPVALFAIDPIWPGLAASVLIFSPKLIQHLHRRKAA